MPETFLHIPFSSHHNSASRVTRCMAVAIRPCGLIIGQYRWYRQPLHRAADDCIPLRLILNRAGWQCLPVQRARRQLATPGRGHQRLRDHTGKTFAHTSGVIRRCAIPQSLAHCPLYIGDFTCRVKYDAYHKMRLPVQQKHRTRLRL